MSVTFESPPEGLKVMSVQAFVKQDFEIHCSSFALFLLFLILPVLFPSFPLALFSIRIHSARTDLPSLVASTPDVPVANAPTQRKLLFYADSSTPLPSSTDDLLDRSNLSRGAPPPLAYEPRALLPQPLARLSAGDPFTYARVTRIPDDDSVRPSSLDGTNTPIRVRHSIVCQVKYRFKGSKKDQVLDMTSPVTIASVRLLFLLLRLSSY
jgi:hypothetical protein